VRTEDQNLKERTKQFALRVIRLFGSLPKSSEAQMLGKQLLRSGTSVGANYREAYRARSRPEFIAKCGDSLRELEESAYWLELLVEGEIMASDKLQSLRNECDD
jgi:four helix bundle protein